MGFSSASYKLWPTNKESHADLSKHLSRFFFCNVPCLSCRTRCELQLSFLLNKYVFLNCQSRPSQRWPVIFYWSSRKAFARKTKTCHQRGKFQQSDLPVEETADCLQYVRRQVESHFCLLTSRWSLTPLWTLFELPWQLVWYETLPTP